MRNYRKKRRQVAYILDKVPAARTNKKLLMIMYWKLFNGIDIPTDVMKQIINYADEPETITRSARHIIQKAREAGENRSTG